MSMFLCPICGKQNSIKNYHPENFENEVEIFHNDSLGYRKGFKKILGFYLAEFPELKEKLRNRINTMSDFLGLQIETLEKVQKIEYRLIEERRKRVAAEEELEELDIDLLLNKLNQALGKNHTSLYSAVNELMSKNLSQGITNNELQSSNNKLKERIDLVLNQNNGIVLRNRELINENKNLLNINQQWSEAYRNLEIQRNQKISEYSAANNRERGKRIKLEEYIEELGLDLLLDRMNNKIDNEHVDLHSAVNELIYDLNLREKEINNALDFINNVLPDEYDIFDDLDEALEAMYQYYEDYVEELEG